MSQTVRPTAAVYTVPTLATAIGATYWQVVTLLGNRPDLADRVVRVSGRRCILAADLDVFRTAFAERHPDHAEAAQ